MNDETHGMPQQDMSGHDRPRQGVSSGFQRANFGTWTMTVDEALEKFEKAGVPRSARTIKRWCKADDGGLVCRKFDFGSSRMWMVDPKSVDVRIAEIKEIEDKKAEVLGQRPRHDMSAHGLPQQDTAGHGRSENSAVKTEGEGVTQDDKESQIVTPPVTDNGMVDFLKEQIAQKDKQIERKDKQIETLSSTVDVMAERVRESNILIKGFQDQLSLKSGKGIDSENAFDETPTQDPNQGVRDIPTTHRNEDAPDIERAA